MCAQCVTGAATAAVAGATGLRAWLGTRRYAWLTPRRTRLVTGVILSGGVLGASIRF